jgi:CRISPR-associated protein Csb1
MMNWNTLENAPRLLLTAELKPAQGHRFQPTGFADLGAAEYRRPDGDSMIQMLLVESAQSVANRLEKTCLDGDGPDLEPNLAGLPYVAATLTGEGKDLRTSSLVEAHRIASPYFLKDKKFETDLREGMAYNPKRPLDWNKIYATLFKYDPNSLVHGVFLSMLEGGRVRAPRAVTGFIEAEHVEKVISGGVKNSPIDPTGTLRAVGGEKDEVYSNVPYARIEYTARGIRAYFNVDLALIRGYRLGPDAARLLTSLCLLKIRRFLTSHLRLRTACDFQLSSDVAATVPEGFTLPQENELLSEVQAGIKTCAGMFATPPTTELKVPVKIVKSKDSSEAAAGGKQ